MSNFIETTSSEQIELRNGEPGDWVQVRVGVTWGEMCDLIDQTVEVDPSAKSDRDAIRKILAGTMQAVRTFSGIAAWGGPGFGDAKPTLVAVRKLKPALGAEIAELVSKYNPGLSGDPKGVNAAESAGTSSSTPAAAA